MHTGSSDDTGGATWAGMNESHDYAAAACQSGNRYADTFLGHARLAGEVWGRH